MSYYINETKTDKKVVVVYGDCELYADENYGSNQGFQILLFIQICDPSDNHAVYLALKQLGVVHGEYDPQIDYATAENAKKVNKFTALDPTSRIAVVPAEYSPGNPQKLTDAFIYARLKEKEISKKA
jgi:hypothetical protein